MTLEELAGGDGTHTVLPEREEWREQYFTLQTHCQVDQCGGAPSIAGWRESSSAKEKQQDPDLLQLS